MDVNQKYFKFENNQMLVKFNIYDFWRSLSRVLKKRKILYQEIQAHSSTEHSLRDFHISRFERSLLKSEISFEIRNLEFRNKQWLKIEKKLLWNTIHWSSNLKFISSKGISDLFDIETIWTLSTKVSSTLNFYVFENHLVFVKFHI